MRYIILVLFLFICACGTTRETQTRTTEQEDIVAGPMTVETPIGNFVVHPTQIRRSRTQFEDTTERKQFEFPEAREVGGAIISGLTGPLFGGGLVGIVAAFLMRMNNKKKEQEKRELESQRDEVIAGVERSKSKLSRIKVDEDTTAWDHLTSDLEKEQSKKTRDVVREKTA